LNYQLLDEREAKQLYEAELSRASSIQHNLLLTEVPQVDGFSISISQEQCRSVGGDLYDIAVLAENKLVVIIADVSGKGLGAALLMSNILASFRILYNVTQFGLSEVIQIVSQQLFESSGPSDFATLFVGVIDLHTHELKYINAGHTPAILVHDDGSQELLEACGIMIGAFPGITWEERKIPLTSGDMVFMFTDGVDEAENESSEMYGQERLKDFLAKQHAQSSDDILKTLKTELHQFAGSAPASDDITMIALKKL
jgi:sigma-B regulation protein RsbU (phosphoserine phosphatase)